MSSFREYGKALGSKQQAQRPQYLLEGSQRICGLGRIMGLCKMVPQRVPYRLLEGLHRG